MAIALLEEMVRCEPQRVICKLSEIIADSFRRIGGGSGVESVAKVLRICTGVGCERSERSVDAISAQNIDERMFRLYFGDGYSFSSNLVSEDSLDLGAGRLDAADEHLMIPTGYNMHCTVSSWDVIHS